eukprot:GHVS01068467.1.p1 GENE.GHVS01068467.1~~GHVS01068467.1.p1  ORF type:complete len:156 (-),score=9.15 GHVS01068467.1:130-597(-)
MNHLAKECKKARPCPGCGGSHHGFVCNSGKDVDDSEKKRNPPNILQSIQVARIMKEQHGAERKDPSSCLMPVTMKGPTGLQAKAVVLLDTESPISMIDQGLEKELQLDVVRQFHGLILGISGEPITSQRADVVEVKVKGDEEPIEGGGDVGREGA